MAAADLQLHDTYYVIGHFHYIVAPGTLFAIFAGIYYWFPKVTGRKMNELLGKLHFWPSFICMNVIFMPMFFVGLAGVSRRLYDSGEQYEFAQPVMHMNVWMTHAAIALMVVQLFFVVNLIWSLLRGEKVERNPWQATTLEWLAPSPPLGHGNFDSEVVVRRGAYEYSVPGMSEDHLTQTELRDGEAGVA